MRVDAASEPSARDAARGVIGLSAFANNRKGDARSADTCVVCASMDHARVSVSLSRSRVEYKWEKISSFHSVRCRSIDDRERAARVRHAPIAKSPHRANIEKRAGKRNQSPSSCTHVIRRSRRSFRCLRLDIIVRRRRRRHRLFFRIRRRGASSSRRPSSPRHRLRLRVALTRRETSRRWWCGLVFSTCPKSVFHVSELCIFIDACARRSGSGFSYTVSSMFVFHHSNSIRDTSDASTRVGVHVSDMWKRRGWASTVD